MNMMICMDSPVLTLVVALFFAVVVEANRNVNPPPPEFSLRPPRHSPSPPPESPYVPVIRPSRISQPPRLAPPPGPPPFTPPPRPTSFTPAPPAQSPHHSHPPLPPPPPPPPREQLHPALSGRGNHNSYQNLSPPPEKEKANMGKKIGLMFVGVAAILQVCIVAFLLISRRQLLKAKNGY